MSVVQPLQGASFAAPPAVSAEKDEEKTIHEKIWEVCSKIGTNIKKDRKPGENCILMLYVLTWACS